MPLRNLEQPHRSSECPEWPLWVKNSPDRHIAGASASHPIAPNQLNRGKSAWASIAALPN
jgi:hypothetical protein